MMTEFFKIQKSENKNKEKKINISCIKTKIGLKKIT